MLALLLAVGGSVPVAVQEGTFEATLQDDENVESLTGEAGFMPLPSMFSIYLDAEEGRCAIHLSGFKSPPSEGTFPVVSEDNLKIRALCILENKEPRERMLAEEGELTITGRSADRLDGRFDFELIGGVTAKKYSFEGSFSSTLKTSI